jgi:hypothetical protein
MQEDTFWLYVNIANDDLNSFIPAWASYRGIIASPKAALPKEDPDSRLGISPYVANLLRNKDEIRLQKELELEIIRKEKFPDCVSRLSCIYCWPDEATAQLAAKYWRTQGKHFDEKYLTPIGATSLSSPTIVDTRWIDKNIILSEESLSEIDTGWMTEYWNGALYPWNGENDIPDQPLMECLVEGVATIWNSEIRERSYEIVKTHTHSSTLLVLAKSMLGVEICKRGLGNEEWQYGQACPMVSVNANEGEGLFIKHYFYMPNTLLAQINEKAQEILNTMKGVYAIPYRDGDPIFKPDLSSLDIDLNWILEHPQLSKYIGVLFPNLLKPTEATSFKSTSVGS